MSQSKMEYHRQRQLEEFALASDSRTISTREVHLEMGRLHAMLEATWRTHLEDPSMSSAVIVKRMMSFPECFAKAQQMDSEARNCLGQRGQDAYAELAVGWRHTARLALQQDRQAGAVGA